LEGVEEENEQGASVAHEDGNAAGTWDGLEVDFAGAGLVDPAETLAQ
jgi:hypothetical protein